MSLHHRLRTAAGSPSDPYWSNTSLLLLGNGTNGGQNNTFIDSSSNAFTITRYGNVTQGSFSPFTIATGSEYSTGTNGGSGYFDGTGDYLVASASASLAFGSGDFTIEWWQYITNSAADRYAGNLTGSWAVNNWTIGRDVAGSTLLFYVHNYSSSSSMLSGTMTANAWNHIALTRSGNTWRLFIDGTQASTVTSSAAMDGGSSHRMVVGCSGDTSSSTQFTTGFISSFRAIKGTAQYTANFTPSTTPLTAITNTSLLLNFSNAAIIDSTGRNDIETVGDAQISTATKKYGTGSLKFDGTGDYLANYSSGTATLMNFGTGDFTIEMWLYFSSTSGSQGIVDNASNTSSALSGKWFLYKDSSGNLIFGEHNVGAILSYSWSPSSSTWYYVAVSRSSGTIKMFVDGTSVASASNSTNFSSAGGIQVGIMASISPLNGYIDDLRITKGVARYTAAFTPPSRQLPAR